MTDSSVVATAIATIVIAVIAFASFWAQIIFARRQLREAQKSFQESVKTQKEVSRSQIATQLWLQMTNVWDSARMYEHRRQLAAQFNAHNRDDQISERVMGFFEDLGSLFRKGRLEHDLTFNSFSYQVIRWWYVCGPYVERERTRKRDDTLFTDFEFLASRMIEMEAKERHLAPGDVIPDAAEIQEFLTEELAGLS